MRKISLRTRSVSKCRRVNFCLRFVFNYTFLDNNVITLEETCDIFQNPSASDFPSSSTMQSHHCSQLDGVHYILAEHHKRVKLLRQRTNENRAFLQQKLKDRLSLKLERKETVEIKIGNSSESIKEREHSFTHTRNHTVDLHRVKLSEEKAQKHKSDDKQLDDHIQMRSQHNRLPCIKPAHKSMNYSNSSSDDDDNITTRHNALDDYLAAKHNVPRSSRKHQQQYANITSDRSSRTKDVGIGHLKLSSRRGYNKDGLPNVLYKKQPGFGAPFLSGAIQSNKAYSEEIISDSDRGDLSVAHVRSMKSTTKNSRNDLDISELSIKDNVEKTRVPTGMHATVNLNRSSSLQECSNTNVMKEHIDQTTDDVESHSEVSANHTSINNKDSPLHLPHISSEQPISDDDKQNRPKSSQVCSQVCVCV